MALVESYVAVRALVVAYAVGSDENERVGGRQWYPARVDIVRIVVIAEAIRLLLHAVEPVQCAVYGCAHVD